MSTNIISIDHKIASILIDATNIKNDAESILKDPKLGVDQSGIFLSTLKDTNNIIKTLTPKLSKKDQDILDKHILKCEENDIVRQVAHYMAAMTLHQKKIVLQVCGILPIGGYSVVHETYLEEIKRKK